MLSIPLIKYENFHTPWVLDFFLLFSKLIIRHFLMHLMYLLQIWIHFDGKKEKWIYLFFLFATDFEKMVWQWVDRLFSNIYIYTLKSKIYDAKIFTGIIINIKISCHNILMGWNGPQSFYKCWLRKQEFGGTVLICAANLKCSNIIKLINFP